MQTRSVIWAHALTIVCCLIGESTELVLPSTSWSAAGPAQSAVTAASVSHRHQRSPPRRPTAGDAALSAPPESSERSSGGHPTSSEAAAACHSTAAARQPGPAARVRPPVMLVNRDGEPHSLASARAGAAGSRPGPLTERAGSADGARRRRRRSLLSPMAVGAGQVLVRLARGPDAPLSPATPRLTASDFLVQFSEIGGRTTQVVMETGGGTRDGAGSEGGSRGIQGQGHGRQDQGKAEHQTSHGRGQETTQPQVSSGQGRHQYQAGAANTAHQATAPQSQRPTEVSDPGADLQPALTDSDRFDPHRPVAGQTPVRSHHDQRRTQQTAASVTVNESVQAQLRPAEADQHHLRPAAPDQPPAYEYKAPDQAQGFNYETSEQGQKYSYEAPDQQQGYEYETPDQQQQYNQETPDKQQGYSYAMPNQQQRNNLKSLHQLEVTITDSQMTQNSNTKLTRTNTFTAPRTPDIGGDRGATGAFHTNSGAGVGSLTGVDISQQARPSPGYPRNNPSPSVSNESAPDGNIRPGRDRDQSSGSRVASEPARRRHPTSSGRRPRPTGVSGHPAPAPPQTDSSVRRPDLTQLQPAGGSAVSNGLSSNPALSAQQLGNLNTVIPALSSTELSGPGQAALGVNNVRPAADAAYQNDLPAAADEGYHYDRPSSSDTGYDPPATGENGYQYNTPPSASSTGYQYSPPSGSDTGYHYDPPAAGGISLNAITFTAPQYHVDHWHRPQPVSVPSPTNASPSDPTAWRPMLKPPAVAPSTVRPELSSGILGPSTAHPNPHAAGVGPSPLRPQLTAADLSPSSAGPEFPAALLDASPSPRGLMWPVLDVLERTMVARMVSAATVGDPDGVLVRHRGTARPPQQQPRRRRRRRAGRSAPAPAAMRHALAMVAALTGRSGAGVEDPRDDTLAEASKRDVPLSQLPLQPSPAVWPRYGEERWQTAAGEVSVGSGSAPVSTAGPGAAPVNTAGSGSAPVITAGSGSAPVSIAGSGSAPVSIAGSGSAPVSTAGSESAPVSTAGSGSAPVSTTGSESAPVSTAGRQQAVLPAPRAMIYPDFRREPGVTMELDQTADGAALWGTDPGPAQHLSSFLDRFPFESNRTGDEHSILGFEGIDSAFGGGFFDSFPDKPFPLKDVVIPDFYFVDEFDSKDNSIASGGSIEGRSSEPNSLVAL